MLVVFFAAGASLQLHVLATLGWIAAAIAGARMIVIWSSARPGRTAAGARADLAKMTGMALGSPAGVTLGLTLIVSKEFPGWGTRCKRRCWRSIALHRLVGPVLYGAALGRAGQVGRMDAVATR